jgi:hypothetical protein
VSYLLQHTRRHPSRRGSSRVDERLRLNHRPFDGGAEVRVFVEDTSNAARNQLQSPRLRLRISDCSNQINLEFAVESAEQRENALFKIDTLLGALMRFRDGLIAEATLYAERERRLSSLIDTRKEVRDDVPEAPQPQAPPPVGTSAGSGAELECRLRVAG